MAKGGIENITEVTTPSTNYPPSGYHNLPTEIIAAINRGETFYLAVEMYLPDWDEIWDRPDMAVFRFSDTEFIWENLKYKAKVKAIPDLSKFIGRTFNKFTLEMMNVQRGLESGSAFVFRTLIRGFRVAVRIIFPDLGKEFSRLIWWGRIVNTEDITENGVKINCSQEIGDFSYELATQKYGQACPLWFGRGECLGNETLEQKSPLFRAVLEAFGQGGCNRTEARCIQLGNRRFLQGQNIVTVTGQFIREEIVKKKILWFFTIKKKNRIPVQWSSKNQSDNDDVNIPIGFGRVRIDLHAFTWADIGPNIIALMGACKGEIQGFYNITCHNPNLTIQSVTQHLGELGGVGTQQPDGRFVQSGENSKLAFLGLTFAGSEPADEGEEVPAVSAVVKASLIPVRDRFGNFRKEWSNNPVWVARALMLNFPYTVVKEAWFNENKNQNTADYCFTVIEDDTDAEIPVISGSSNPDFEAGLFTRFRSTNRFDSQQFQQLEAIQQGLSRQYVHTEDKGDLGEIGEGSAVVPELISIDALPDIWWTSPIGNSILGQSRTYLALRYTTNLIINDKAKLSDILFSLVFPTFRGYMRFNHFGEIEIDCRKPADNSFIRDTTPIASTEIPIASTEKFAATYGYLLIGVGKKTAEIAKIKGVRYVNGSAEITPTVSSGGSIALTVSPAFIERDGGPWEIYMDFSGQPVAGERIELKFTEGVSGQNVLSWDYFVDSSSDSLDVVVQMFRTRLLASPAFREHWTADVFSGFPNRIVIRNQTGYLKLDRPLQNPHFRGEEVLRVVEVYEDGKDPDKPVGIRDNMKDFVLGLRRQETYHGVTGTYISAVQDFRETQIQPRIAWDAAEQERNLKLLELDLRGVDNYRQAGWLTKSATVDFVDGNLYSSWRTGIRGVFHEEGELVAVRHQTMEGLSYTPFTIEEIKYDHQAMETPLVGKLYLSAAFDERVAKEEKFLEATLTTNEDYQAVPPPTLTQGGYSSVGTGDGAGGIRQNNIQYETQKMETFPVQQVYSPEGRDKL